MKYISTFSIVALDPETGELGVAVQSKFLAVRNAVGWAKAGVGAIATQALANLDFGEIGLKLLEKGYSAEKTLQTLLALDDNREDRQGTLARRLAAALDKAQDAGGDRRGRQSASLLVVKEKGSYGGYNDRYIDLRVDDDPEPIKKLIHLLDLHEMYFNKTKPEEMLAVEGETANKIQKALKELGYYQGDITGSYDESTKRAYFDFCGIENFEERICEGNFVDKKVLEFLLNKAGNI